MNALPLLLILAVLAPAGTIQGKIDSLQAAGQFQADTLLFQCPPEWVDSLVLDSRRHPLLAKLLTAFLAKKEKAYRIQEGDSGWLAVESWHTVQPGSRYRCWADTGGQPGMRMYYDLILKKGFTFRCASYLEMRPLPGEGSRRLAVSCWYQVPKTVYAANRVVRAIRGRGPVEGKVMEFWGRSRNLLEQLARTPAPQLTAVLNDTAGLAQRRFPVRFTMEETVRLKQLFGY